MARDSSFAGSNPHLAVGWLRTTALTDPSWRGLFLVAGLALASAGVGWQFAGPYVPAGLMELAPLLFLAASVIAIVLAHCFARSHLHLARAEAEAEQLRLLFAELQHRMSNNLAAAGALLAMQGRQIADPDARRLLGRAAARIATASRLGRRLHDPSAQAIDFGAFLRDAAPEVLALAGAEGRLEVHVKAEELVLPASLALPLGLVAVELLSNAIEHGVPADPLGRVDVSLERVGPDMAQLIVRHDGSLPPGFDLAEIRSLGLVVARQLAAQAGAKLAIRGDQGVVSNLTFPLGLDNRRAKGTGRGGSRGLPGRRTQVSDVPLSGVGRFGAPDYRPPARAGVERPDGEALKLRRPDVGSKGRPVGGMQ